MYTKPVNHELYEINVANVREELFDQKCLRKGQQRFEPKSITGRRDKETNY